MVEPPAGPNIYEPHFEPVKEANGFVQRRARIGWAAGSKRLGAGLLELRPGETAFPYHFHYGNEELLVVLEGRPHLRTPDGLRQLDRGEVVAFPVGERGAHQVTNRTDEAVRFLIVSEMNGPDVLHYPDSGKIGARERPPGEREAGFWRAFHVEDAVDYWDGESPPG
jgi:uncharacterized cupin superfamily protein